MAKLIDNQLNIEVRAWTRQTTFLSKKRMEKYGIGRSYLNGKSDGVQKFNGVVYPNKYGEADRIGFGMKKHMVFVHKGVGRGYPISKTYTAQASEALSATGKHVRYEKPFLNPVLDDQVPKLADVVMNHVADAAVKGFQIK